MRVLVHLKSDFTHEMALDDSSSEASCEDIADSLTSILNDMSVIRFEGPDGSWVICNTSEISHIKVYP